MLRRHFIINIDSGIPNNEIWYTSSNEDVVTPYKTDVFGANIVSNTYENGKGIIKFDNSVTYIGNTAFIGSSLTSITIGESVTSIGGYAFAGCETLTSITYEGTQEQWNAISKGDDWNINVPATVVNCTDGDVEI